jgi:hypothetical protein
LVADLTRYIRIAKLQRRGEGMSALAGCAGSSAGALIGLQFVVITLIADRAVGPGQAEAGAAFATPTIIHFCAVLLLSGIVSAPWPNIARPTVVLGSLGLCGIVYEIIVARRMRIQSIYTPEFEDWLFHVLLPLAAYATLVGSAYATRLNLGEALFGVAAAALLLLFIGIHNAWDAVTYHVFVARDRHRGGEPR